MVSLSLLNVSGSNVVKKKRKKKRKKKKKKKILALSEERENESLATSKISND